MYWATFLTVACQESKNAGKDDHCCWTRGSDVCSGQKQLERHDIGIGRASLSTRAGLETSRISNLRAKPRILSGDEQGLHKGGTMPPKYPRWNRNWPLVLNNQSTTVLYSMESQFSIHGSAGEKQECEITCPPLASFSMPAKLDFTSARWKLRCHYAPS